MGFKLSSDSVFQYFRQKGEVGNGPEVVHSVRVLSRFFEDGGDGSQFERLGN